MPEELIVSQPAGGRYGTSLGSRRRSRVTSRVSVRSFLPLFPEFFHPFPDVDDLSQLVLRLPFVDFKQVQGVNEFEELFESVIPCIEFRALLLDVLPHETEFCPALFIRRILNTVLQQFQEFLVLFDVFENSGVPDNRGCGPGGLRRPQDLRVSPAFKARIASSGVLTISPRGQK